MDAAAETELHGRIVRSIVGSLTSPWDAAVINIEIDVVDGDQTENCLALSFLKRENAWQRSGFGLPYVCYDLFSELRLTMQQPGGQYWKICTLEISRKGKYRFQFS